MWPAVRWYRCCLLTLLSPLGAGRNWLRRLLKNLRNCLRSHHMHVLALSHSYLHIIEETAEISFCDGTVRL
jgi:hypothetical protein